MISVKTSAKQATVHRNNNDADNNNHNNNTSKGSSGCVAGHGLQSLKAMQ